MTGPYLSPLWISFKTVLCATAITFVLGIIAARWMARYHGRLKSLIDGVFIIPLVLPPTVVGLFLLEWFGIHGPMGKLLDSFGTTVVFSWSATVITATVMAFPLMYMTTRSAFELVDPNIENAARTLGANEWRVFRSVTLPMAWPGIVAGTILTSARCMGEFGATMMLAGNIPGKTTTIPMAIYFEMQSGDMFQARVLCAIVMAIALGSLAIIAYWKGKVAKAKIPAVDQLILRND